jgi:hypothetical protein
MDFNDTPEEAAFRAEVRAWLQKNAKRKDPDDPGESILSERTSPDARYTPRAKAMSPTVLNATAVNGMLAGC